MEAYYHRGNGNARSPHERRWSARVLNEMYSQMGRISGFSALGLNRLSSGG